MIKGWAITYKERKKIQPTCIKLDQKEALCNTKD